MSRTDALVLSRLRGMLQDGSARRIRVAAGLSLAEVGSAAGADRSSVSRWETGKRRPRGAAALRYAALLEVLTREAGER